MDYETENLCDRVKYTREENQYSQAETKIYWCKHCLIPVYKERCPLCGKKTRYLAMDLRPVFPEEILLLEVLLRKKGELRGKSIWNGKGNRYYINGEPLDFSVQGVLTEWQPEMVRRQLDELKALGEDIGQDEFDEMIARFTHANEERLQKNEYDSFECIRLAVDTYPNRIKMVSFSGGKDSTVVSSLARRALGTSEVLHVFGDTTLEFPATYDYVEAFRRKNRRVPFLATRPTPDSTREKGNHRFMELCERIGPPSRVMRWCCTTFKTGPISMLIDYFSEDKQVLTFYGVRSVESTRRSKYKEVMKSPKIAKQVVASPIMDWLDLDVWLYLLYNQEDFNSAYRQGFSRVGCWCCPSNSDWAFFLAQIYLPEQAKEWRDFLVGFAKRIGKPDAEEYVDSGNWKARQGGNGLDVNYEMIKVEPCANEALAKNFYLNRPIESGLYEYFKPFGNLNYSMGRKLLGEVYVLDRQTQEPVLILQGREGQPHLKIIAVNPQNFTLLMKRVECQLRKFQACIFCGACPAICKGKAISLLGDRYSIDEKKCIGCMACVAYYDLGCLVTKVTKTKIGGSV